MDFYLLVIDHDIIIIAKKITGHILCILQERNLRTSHFYENKKLRKRNNYVYTYTQLSLCSSRTLFTVSLHLFRSNFNQTPD